MDAPSATSFALLTLSSLGPTRFVALAQRLRDSAVIESWCGAETIVMTFLYDSRQAGALSDRLYPEGWDVVESDRHFYMRRVTAERLAAARAVTEEARKRRLVLIETYLQKLQAMPA
ncbi:MAG: hypothetical protein V4460_10135 [Pseudomonadota bacterium]